MKKLEGENLNKLMVYLHEVISKTADSAVEGIKNNKTSKTLCYPPGITLNDAEMNILAQIRNIEGFEGVLRKIIMDCSSYPLFDLFSIIDGVADIPDVEYEFLEIIECKPEEKDDRDDFLHDYFYETYWDCEEGNR